MAEAGGFVAFDITEAFLKNKNLLDCWQNVLLASSHGHTNLFTMIHIIFGLTVVYIRASTKIKLYRR